MSETFNIEESLHSRSKKFRINRYSDERVPVMDLNTDSANFDAFARLRTSEPYTVFDSKQIHNSGGLIWDDQEVSGSGTGSSWSQNAAAVTLSVGTAAGRRVRQTYRRFNYQPGKSQLFFLTGQLGSGGGTGITRCMGFYDDQNGIFARDNKGNIEFVRRSYASGSPVDSAIAQADWNLDPMDGTGGSGVTLDGTKAQILVIDMEWLGVGRMRVGFVVDGIPIFCHQFLHSNRETGVYMSTPNLPIRYEIENDGTGSASTLIHICSTAISEGGQQEIGVDWCNSNQTTAVVAASSGTVYALCGIRLRSANLDATVKPISVSILELNTVDYEWMLIFNPTIAGTAPTFADQDSNNSSVQFAVGVAANTVTGGQVTAAGYVKGGKESGSLSDQLQTNRLLGSAIDGTQDELWLCARPLAANADFLGSIAWREIS